MSIGIHVKYTVFLSDFNQPSVFSTYFLKILKYQISWISILWEIICVMWADGRADVKKLMAIFRNLANAL